MNFNSLDVINENVAHFTILLLDRKGLGSRYTGNYSARRVTKLQYKKQQDPLLVTCPRGRRKGRHVYLMHLNVPRGDLIILIEIFNQGGMAIRNDKERNGRSANLIIEEQSLLRHPLLFPNQLDKTYYLISLSLSQSLVGGMRLLPTFD